MGRPREQRLRLYGSPSDHPGLAWAWVDRQLAAAGTYWVIARSHGLPHPRPVWGIWLEQQLHLSVGSPTLRRAIQGDPAVTVHLGSGTDVVILEGLVIPVVSNLPAVIQAYDHKYAWTYDVDRYGSLVQVEPTRVIAWRAAGTAGRDGFESTGCWAFNGSA